jgi:hypothetical protein
VESAWEIMQRTNPRSAEQLRIEAEYLEISPEEYIQRQKAYPDGDYPVPFDWALWRRKLAATSGAERVVIGIITLVGSISLVGVVSALFGKYKEFIDLITVLF